MNASAPKDISTRTGRIRLRLTFWLLLGIAALYLIVEHRAHLIAGAGWLPILLLLACPLIHMLGHGGHGSHRGLHAHRDQEGNRATDTEPPVPQRTAKPHRHPGDLP